MERGLEACKRPGLGRRSGFGAGTACRQTSADARRGAAGVAGAHAAGGPPRQGCTGSAARTALPRCALCADQEGPTCAEKMAFMTAMYCEGTSGAAASTRTRAACACCPGPVPPPPVSSPSGVGAPPGRAAPMRRCWELRKHSVRLSALLSWQAAPAGGGPPAVAAAADAALSACCSPDRTETEGGQAASAAAAGPAAAGGRQEGDE